WCCLPVPACRGGKDGKGTVHWRTSRRWHCWWWIAGRWRDRGDVRPELVDVRPHIVDVTPSRGDVRGEIDVGTRRIGPVTMHFRTCTDLPNPRRLLPRAGFVSGVLSLPSYRTWSANALPRAER